MRNIFREKPTPKVSYPWFGYGTKDGGVIFHDSSGGIKPHLPNVHAGSDLYLDSTILVGEFPFSEEKVPEELLKQAKWYS